MKIVHLTDTHVVAGNGSPAGLSPGERLRAAVDSINAEHGDAAFVVVTGDLSDSGDVASYESFGAEIRRLKLPYHLLVGNHDDRDELFRAFPDLPRDNEGFVQSSAATPFGRCLFLDTHVPGSGVGEYCPARQGWLRADLERDAEPVILFMHHPPMPVGMSGMDDIRLANGDAFHALLAPHASRIRHLFFGHLHRPVWGTWRGIPFSCMRGTSHQVALDLDGATDRVLGTREPPAYGIVLLSDEQVTVHMHDYTNAFRTVPI
ncbi:MAG: phosphodiesterase [Boseongicola sp.]|nr:phosphodiesterase [Boseongicola sp.]